MSRAWHNIGPRQRSTAVTVPERVSPHVKLIFAEMRRLNVTYDEVEEGSGVLRNTMKAWRVKNKPSLESLEAVLGFLGYDFVPIPRDKIIPPHVAAELKQLADKLNAEMPVSAQLLIEIVTGIHDRLKPVSARKNVVPMASRRRSKEPHPDMGSMFEGIGVAA